jgi:hypothetical protein
MRLAAVLVQVDIDRGKRHPLTVRRDDGFAHPLELHHIFKSEGTFALRKSSERAADKEKNETP